MHAEVNSWDSGAEYRGIPRRFPAVRLGQAAFTAKIVFYAAGKRSRASALIRSRTF